MKNSRTVNTFKELVVIDSESKNEERFQKFLKEKCETLGLNVYEDDTKKTTGLGAGNIIATLPATDETISPLIFCAHSDTVVPGVGIQPKVKDGRITSDGTTILAADNKAGIAICLELVSRLQETKAPHGELKFVFTVGEEIGLVGANALDMDALGSKYGYVLDSGGPVGAVTMASPTMFVLDVIFNGKAAHAGLEPEKGVSAITMAAKAIAKMRLGRIDEETTANIGTIQGGAATNIVAEHAEFSAEVRSISHEYSEELLQEMIGILEETAAEFGGSVKYKTDMKTRGFRLNKDDYTVQLASKAITAIGREPRFEVSGGASDANSFNAKGIETANISIGYEKVHTLYEYIPIEELEKAVEVAYYLATNHA